MLICKKRLIILSILTFILSSFTLPVFADDKETPSDTYSPTSDICQSDAADIVKQAAGCSESGDGALVPQVQTIIGYIISVLGLVAVVFIIIGGVKYMTSQGESDKLVKARHTILYATIGLVICALAFAITNWVIGIVNEVPPQGQKSPTGGEQESPTGGEQESPTGGEQESPTDGKQEPPTDGKQESPTDGKQESPTDGKQESPGEQEPPDQKVPKKVEKVSVSISSSKISFNDSSKKATLSVKVSPSDATKQSVTWKTSDKSIVTVDKDGVLTAVGPGKATITATASDGSGVSGSTTITVTKKVVMFLGASNIYRMASPEVANIQSFTANSGNVYSTRNDKPVTSKEYKEATLKYIYKSGSGFDYLKSEIWPAAAGVIKQYKNVKKYVDFYIYYKYPGNTISKYNCDKLKEFYDKKTDIFSETSNDGVIYYLNSVVNKLNDAGYKVHAYLQEMHPVRYQDAKTDERVVSSSSPERCEKRSNYKYAIVNTYIEKQFKAIKPKNITLIQEFKEIVDVNEATKGNDVFLSSWKDKYTEWRTIDGFHLQKDFIPKYLQSLLDRNPDL